MEFNIAFNTVFYISIFIIPGILLRRFYYSGEFNKEFAQGHLLERLMWIIFGSIISLFASALFFLFVRFLFGSNLLSAISYDTIKEVFGLLSANELPDETRFKLIYKDFLILLFGIYLLSFLIGILMNKLVTKIGLDTTLSIFKFKNYWYYYVRGRVPNAPKDKGKEYWYTEADVLVEQDGKAKMYSGKITDYFIDGTTNQLESLFLEDIKKYRFSSQGDKNYELVNIPGHVFCVPFQRILNINLTYINREKQASWWRKALWYSLKFTYYILFILLFSLFWIEDIPFIEFDEIFYKILFFINSWIILSLLLSVLEKLILPMLIHKEEPILIDVFTIALFAVQFFWVIGNYTFVSIFFPSLIVFSIIMSTINNPGSEIDKKEEGNLADLIRSLEDDNTENEGKKGSGHDLKP